ncbi:MAG: CoA transferase [Planctomycetes bacterium]|nr:CoA transferase [Planctomycetota bacterium]
MSSGALSHVRVLDLSRALSGPYCSMLLADQGADVIKIEAPGGGDVTRHLRPYVNGEGVEFLALNRNKKSIVLDLKSESGRQAFLDLVAVSDVVLENMRPGVVDRLGVGYAAANAVNPRIVYCSISGFGSSGPLRDLPAYDIVVQGMSGTMSLTGEPGRPPVMMGPPMGDLAAGVFAALGITTALTARGQTNRGRYVDISMLDCQISLLAYFGPWYMATGEVPQPRGGGNPRLVPFGVFRARDAYITVGVLGEEPWQRFCKAAELDHLLEDPRFATNELRSEHRAELLPVVERAFLGRDAEDWIRRLRVADIPCGPVNTVDRALATEQVHHRNMVVETHHPVAGAVRVLGNPVKLSDSPDEFLPAPTYGQHTREILSGLLGYTDEEVAKVVGSEPAGAR